MIDIEDFERLEIKMGRIIEVEKVEGSKKLLKLSIDLGEDDSRQIISGIAEFFLDTSVLIGKQIPVLSNLEPKNIKGLRSEGMILAVGGEDSFSLLIPEEEVPNGSYIH